MGGISALVGGAGNLGILGTKAVVGGQRVGWCDQRHLVPTASVPTGSSWGWEHCWRKAAHNKESALVTKGLISWSLVSLQCLPEKGSIVDTLHQPWLFITSVVSGFISTSICMVFSKTANLNFTSFLLEFSTKKVHSSLNFLRRCSFSHLEKLSQFSHIVLYFTSNYTPP